MLVLSRKPGEQVYVGNDIIITVTEVSGGKVKIGIEAPRRLPVLRGELTLDNEVDAFRRQWTASPSEFKTVAS